MLSQDIAILVIDDSVEDGRILEENLAQSGHSRRLHFCRSTQEAFEIMAQSSYTMILTDHRPPEIDAFQLLKYLTTHKNGTPVLILTGRGNEKLAAEVIKQGAYDYLTKNEVKSESIAHILETVIERQHLKEEAERAQQRLEALATQDSLTATYNRRYFQERLDEEFQRAQRYRHPLSLVLLDLDSFKHVNDQFGHLAGDMVLSQVAKALKIGVRRVDVVARFGGDEFAVILPETNHQQALNLSERLRMRVAQSNLEFEGLDQVMTASFGVASIGPDITSAESLVAAADRALYDSKTKGRNQVSSALSAVSK